LDEAVEPGSAEAHVVATDHVVDAALGHRDQDVPCGGRPTVEEVDRWESTDSQRWRPRAARIVDGYRLPVIACGGRCHGSALLIAARSSGLAFDDDDSSDHVSAGEIPHLRSHGGRRACGGRARYRLRMGRELPIIQFEDRPGILDLSWGHPAPSLLPVQ